MWILLYLLAYIGFGFWARYMAKKRGRNQILAFVLGFFFTVFTLLGYLIIGDAQDLADKKMIAREKHLKELRKQAKI